MANEGNKWWEHRSSHGRDVIFSSPDILWSAAKEYFESSLEDQITEKQLFAYQGACHTGTLKRHRPFSYERLCLFLHVNTAYFRQFKIRIRKNIEEGIDVELNEGFSTVMKMIDDVIYSQQFDGASTGQFKESIISKYLGLKERTEVSTPADGDGEFKVTLKL
jgi:hypothetical protein